MRWKIYILAIASFLVGTSEFVISGILDMLAKDVGVSVAAAGQLITVYSLAYAIGTPILVALTARIDRKKLMLSALVLFFIGNLITITSTGYGMLMGARIILAISTGVFMVVALTVATKIAHPGKQGGSIATVLLGFNLALILGVPLGRVIAGSYDWKVIFTGIGVLSLLAMLVLLLAIPKSEGEAPVPIREQLALFKTPRISVALSISFFWILGYTILYTYITPFLLTITGMSERMVSIGLFAFGLASLLGSQVGGYGADKWGIPRTMVGGLIFHSGILFLLTVFSHYSMFVLPLLMLWSFFAWSTGPVQQVYLIGMAPQASGIILSLNNSIVQLGMAVGAVIGGLIVDSISLAAAGWLGGIGVALGLIPAVYSLSMRRRSALEEQTLEG
ncbi:DHA1 family putative efflux transporter-like MFS transporter [Paenibacillus rhizosphaerae]|uniref:DHA1 family putative efflux transporter-like MFS transporter n=1 Tax=Paenibacillus rhizosphaerae TaxID=297318 RepID=A0A839U2X0_9BACL|nr:MFS transporter [Paenibacillus rhizosphaerae]MBB3131207.1 DHA1 family putative efflux transporter-like MFS transporter [Paenibacillus rhizosphaerae]